MQLSNDEPGRQAARAQKAREQATRLYPNEKWNEYAPGIYIAESRMPKSAEQVKTLEKELAQAQILAAMGHTVYLPPESGTRKTKHPDAIVDGLIMEFKTVTGNIRKVAENFKAAREKAESVFMTIVPDYSKEAVQRKLKGTILSKGYHNGLIVVHFNATGQTYYWNTDDIV